MGADRWLKRARAVLILGRISNLPTVWSNCLAAWLLGGGGPCGRFSLLCAGATLLYTGGMFLNDAMDIGFDRRYRPERPIISGQVSIRFVSISSAVLLLGGWLCLVPLGGPALLFGLGLAGTIVLYDVVHKKTKLAPVLMAGCRFLLCLAASSAAQKGIRSPIVWHAAGLAAYIIGLSYLARRESTGPRVSAWPIPLLSVPVILALTGVLSGHELPWKAGLAVVGWIVWCLSSQRAVGKIPLPRGVAGLLAGIALLDWLTVSSLNASLACVCLALFLLAIVLQRIAPAT